MDEGGGITYMMRAMRMLLLLSAFLTALTGVVTGSAVAAQPVQVSACAAQARPRAAIAIAAPHRAAERGFATVSGWHVAACMATPGDAASFGERRRL
jgi:hypothetical protein